ncbi:NTP transferase domain-containing protein [Catenuloplanes japonicus]|uniref:NTP transferase domain-containing protein n=1 Tax=Catenuloplanes japonicus TaxID=33876 RepID=UPI000524D33E|nr:NTP transferase domain-containing protein [Catenuloplanes japonicus]
MSDIAAVILAAGEGQRLRPLTLTVPKALCPVGNVPLLDRALARVEALGLPAAVNAAYLGEAVARHVEGRAHVSVEPDGPLGTGGGLARLRSWVDGRGVLLGNADAYLHDADLDPGADIAALLEGWDGESVRMLGRPAPAGQGEFGEYDFAGFSLLPWRFVATLPDHKHEVVRSVWRPAEREGALSVIPYGGTYLDTGTPALYLAANLHTAPLIASSALVSSSAVVERSVVGDGAVVRGDVRDSVVWPGGHVAEGEVLTRSIRVGNDLTVAVEGPLA